MMVDSGARGSQTQVRQLGGYAWADGQAFVARSSRHRSPPTSAKVLTVLQYFISTHGARKGLADTALKTANSGYLTRRLGRCGSGLHRHCSATVTDCMDGMEISSASSRVARSSSTWANASWVGLRRRTFYDPYSDEILVGLNEMIDEAACRCAGAGRCRPGQDSHALSVVRCVGVFAPCATVATWPVVSWSTYGEAIGVIAAQSIGEPGTQLTMRTFPHWWCRDRPS